MKLALSSLHRSVRKSPERFGSGDLRAVVQRAALRSWNCQSRLR